MDEERLSLGEYIRRLRRGASRPLGSVAEGTGISYTHLSRIENDSIVPSADSLVKIAEVLGGDLSLMLQKKGQLASDTSDGGAASGSRHRLLRRGVPGSSSGRGNDSSPEAKSLDVEPTEEDVADLAELIGRLDTKQRRLVKQLIIQLGGDSDGPR